MVKKYKKILLFKIEKKYRFLKLKTRMIKTFKN
jgi:hypothetical protein